MMLPGRLPMPAALADTVGAQPEILGPPPQQQVERHQQATAPGCPSAPAGSAPASVRDQRFAATATSVIEPTPTPEKAMLSASPRRRTNQLVRYSDWPV